MFEFMKKNKTEIKPESKEEELSFMRARNAHAERNMETVRAIEAERAKYSSLKNEAFHHSTAGKVVSKASKLMVDIGNISNSHRLKKKDKGLKKGGSIGKGSLW